MFYAHSGQELDKSDWQSLCGHLLAVATLASEMAKPFGLQKAAFYAGLFHDLGKYTAAFQRRLEGGPGVPHSTAGAAMLLELTSGMDRRIAEMIAYAILGHHAGLPDRSNASESCYEHRIKNDRYDLDPVWRTEISAEISGLLPGTDLRINQVDPQQAAFQLSLVVRMLFSCLIDADRKDTERFSLALQGKTPDREWRPLHEALPDFTAAFDQYMATKSRADTDLNRLRGEILDHVRGKAKEPRGLFTLTVPTGGGKTLASLGFALDHAKVHGHTRIIYAIPFTSIIDQTATIFREIFGDGNVLEHHSAIDEETVDAKGPRGRADKLKLAMEDWAAPVVVTTNVQLFESLFAAKTSRARKLHNIAGSIIILDEAQTLPRHLLMPCLSMLDALALSFGCTIVLCTATQPAVDENALKGGLKLAGRELAPDPGDLARQLRRAHIRHAGAMTNADLIEALKAEPQALVIVNSRKHALELYNEAKVAGLAGLVHLTTRQYAAHRREILKDVRSRLSPDDPQPCRVIATSLIEAGVDVDFPKVWRSEAGLDSIVQAAGRCNREGRRAPQDSIVTVFTAPDYAPPTEIKGLIGDMKRIIDKHDDLLSLDAIKDYFGEVYWRAGDRLDGREKDKAILPRIQYNRGVTDFAFRSIAEDFKMIESGMEPVIIAGDDVADEWIKKLGVEKISSGAIARKLQTYIVQVPPKARALLVKNGYAKFERTDLRGDQFCVLDMKGGLYREEIGLFWEDAEYLGAEDIFI